VVGHRETTLAHLFGPRNKSGFSACRRAKRIWEYRVESIGDHEFGSGLTDLKLSVVAEYLHRYNMALSKQPFFQRWYFDAFAGTGERTVRLSGSSGDLISEPVEEASL